MSFTRSGTRGTAEEVEEGGVDVQGAVHAGPSRPDRLRRLEDAHSTVPGRGDELVGIVDRVG
ncbi:hypothetical protein GCM10010109_56690 [Actinoplanes campanulatus]|nr:hypothetical protein GCM10010109_56690 [Actinoplanes campanulatus]GID38655.1 hypothetical protein Aca09nite_51610 [Actinoplanes campanulatus]